jgi:hypothetical protein
MTTRELIAQVQSRGCQIGLEGSDLVLTAKEPLPGDLVQAIRDRKPDLLEYLRLTDSCRRIEDARLAIRIKAKDGGQGWWLAASTAQSAVDDDAPVYLAG